MLSFIYNLDKCLVFKLSFVYSFNEAISIQAIVCL